MELSIIAGIDRNLGIGKDNNLLFHVSEDLKRFKRLTTGHTIIMGRKTFESLPNGPLPERKHIILSHNKDYLVSGCIVVQSVNEALKHCEPDKENFVIGGGTIYKLFLPYSTKIYFTQIDAEADANTVFPEYSQSDWETEEKTEWKIDKKSGLVFRYLTLIRS